MQASSGLLNGASSGNGNGNGNGGSSPSNQIRQGRLGASQPVPGMALPVPPRQTESYNVERPGGAASGLRGGDGRSPPDIADHPMLDSPTGSQNSFELARQNPLLQSGEAAVPLQLQLHCHSS